ncbi:hypothetical protein DL764_008656 [Monosporascus ibericus]|uniref:UBX domain-containing protein n=1 Tax=Monosporascus ibericus TaxID=155417 RepID=A0A4Q4SZ73_9PEZI|nr:hypothetical protein DL764_008656 [Monosporascus ibericus]
MFFQGSLQEGINAALQEAKLVVCFVTDEGGESLLWENEFLTDESLKSSLESQAVALRLQDGSQEAGFLEALFPLPRKPTLVMIQNGQLKEYIAAGTSKEDFLRRAHAALGTSSGQSRQQPEAPATPAAQTLEPSQAATPATPAAEENVAPPRASSSEGTARDARIRAMLAERAKRLEADKKAKEAAAKAEAETRAKARGEVDASAESSAANNAKGAERKYADELRQRKQQAAEERRRILRRIEDDRRERKEREAQERQARLLAEATNPETPSGGSGGGSYGVNGSSSLLPSAGAAAATSSIRRGGRGTDSRTERCNLQVRLLDGSTMRAGFPASGTLAGDVRPWIDSNRTDGSDAPYTFRVVLTPLPNRAVDAGEETGSTLAELGLTPSATLVLVPVPRFAEAYYGRGSSSSGGSLLWRALAFLWGIPAGILGMLAGFLFGWGRGGRQQRRRRDEGGRGGGSGGDEVELDDAPARGTTTSARIRGFENEEDRRRDAQLYNGNSLNFEPRRDDEEDGEQR